MKNFQYLVPLFACMLSLNACQKEQQEDLMPVTSSEMDNSELRSANVGVIKLGDCHRFTNYETSVCLTAINESRCPCDVTCVWEGSVEYMLTVESKGEEATFILQPPGNPTNAPSSATIGNVRIVIEEAKPVRCVDYGNYSRYRLKVTVSEFNLNDITGTELQTDLNKATYQKDINTEVSGQAFFDKTVYHERTMMDQPKQDFLDKAVYHERTMTDQPKQDFLDKAVYRKEITTNEAGQEFLDKTIHEQ